MAETSTKSVDAIRADIDRARAEIEQSVVDLKTSLHDSLDWRRAVRRHPVAWFLGAMAVGAFLGSRR